MPGGHSRSLDMIPYGRFAKTTSCSFATALCLQQLQQQSTNAHVQGSKTHYQRHLQTTSLLLCSTQHHCTQKVTVHSSNNTATPGCKCSTLGSLTRKNSCKAKKATGSILGGELPHNIRKSICWAYCNRPSLRSNTCLRIDNQ